MAQCFPADRLVTISEIFFLRSRARVQSQGDAPVSRGDPRDRLTQLRQRTDDALTEEHDGLQYRDDDHAESGYREVEVEWPPARLAPW